jgi:ubiquinone biosynthesis protein UbiJ
VPSRFTPDAIPGAIANQVLERETWARQRLAAHSGRVFAVAVGPLTSALAVDASGMVEPATLADRPADATLRVSPLDLPAFLADPSRFDRYVSAEGDAALVATLKDLAQTLPWFVEHAFARVLGPIAGQRVADAGRALLAFPGSAAERIGESVIGYARDEAGLIARGDEARTFGEQVALLAVRVDGIAARIERLAQRIEAGEGAKRAGARTRQPKS